MPGEGTRIVRTLRKATDHEARKLVLDVVADLVAATPVDTGWARANWLPSLNTPVESAAGSQNAVDHGAQQIGIATIATSFKGGQSAFITNNVPYIEALNAGHSPQAPAGFVQAIINKRVDAFNGPI